MLSWIAFVLFRKKRGNDAVGQGFSEGSGKSDKPVTLMGFPVVNCTLAPMMASHVPY
tara:strand:+ start:237 stop:407 length:171 start_codon:yes stop_codon:yes gene_type:complete